MDDRVLCRAGQRGASLRLPEPISPGGSAPNNPGRNAKDSVTEKSSQAGQVWLTPSYAHVPVPLALVVRLPGLKHSC